MKHKVGGTASHWSIGSKPKESSHCTDLAASARFINSPTLCDFDQMTIP
jgi:hypothetical protein